MSTNASYIQQVDAALTFSGSARRQALNDLRDLLTEVSADDLGGPAEYAAALNEQLGDVQRDSILGMPLSLISGLGERLANTFDPADDRLFVPRLFGIGWTLNMGKVAVALGLLRPDDIDAEILADAADDLSGAQTAAALTIAAAAGTTAAIAGRRRTLEAHGGESLRSSIIAGTILPVLAAGLLTASTSRTTPPAQRLTLPSAAASLAAISAAGCLQTAVKPGGKAIVLPGIAAAGTLQLVLSYLPVRRALHARWHAARR